MFKTRLKSIIFIEICVPLRKGRIFGRRWVNIRLSHFLAIRNLGAFCYTRIWPRVFRRLRNYSSKEAPCLLLRRPGGPEIPDCPKTRKTLPEAHLRPLFLVGTRKTTGARKGPKGVVESNMTGAKR